MSVKSIAVNIAASPGSAEEPAVKFEITGWSKAPIHWRRDGRLLDSPATSLRQFTIGTHERSRPAGSPYTNADDEC